MTNFSTELVPIQPIPPTAQKVFTGVIFDTYQWEQIQFDGSTKTFEKLKRPDTVLIIAVTTENKVLFIHEEQPGKKPFWGLVGGRVEKDEESAVAARRELLEETGYVAEEYICIDVAQPFSKIDWKVFTYVARNCHKVDEQSLDVGEKITLELVEYGNAVTKMAQDDFGDHQSQLARASVKALYDKDKYDSLQKIVLGTSSG